MTLRDIKHSVTVSVEPTEEPITVARAKDQLNITFNERDPHIGELITEARIGLEDATETKFVTQTLILLMDRFPTESSFRPPWTPLASVTSIQYLDTNGDTQTFASGSYRVDTSSKPGRISLAYNASWPTIRNISDAVTVTYVVGFGAASAVPQNFKNLLRVIVAEMYELRRESSELRLQDSKTFQRALGLSRMVEIY